MPSGLALEQYYAHNYRVDYKSTHRPKPKHVQRAGTVALQRLNRLRALGTIQAGMHTLDIGAGGGEFTYLANKAGLYCEGVEPNYGYSDYARDAYGVKVSTTSIEAIDHTDVELVTLFHVLEHLADPLESAKKLFSVIRADGLLMIEVPNVLQMDASPHNIFFKAHLHYFSKYTLGTAMSQYFQVLHVEDTGNLTMIFKKRPSALAEMQLPSSSDLEIISNRLREKGWLEYLTVGGGWKKPLKKLKRTLHEARLQDSGRPLLDKLYDQTPIQF